MIRLNFDTTAVAIAPVERAAGESRRDAERRAALVLVRELTGIHDAVIDHFPWGEPTIIGHPDISLTVSHSRRLVAVAIDCTRRIGIDIEEPRSQLLNVAARFLSDEERTMLDLFPGERDELLGRLTRTWTMKEAMVKLCGGRTVSMCDDLRAVPEPAICGEPCTVIADTDIDGHHMAILTI